MAGYAVAASEGMRWTAASQFGRRAAQLATTALLARLLTAKDFGLAGMATVLLDFALVFRDFGMTAAVIQAEQADDELLSTVFWVNLALGGAIALGIIAVAPLVARFYGEPILSSILQTHAAVFLAVNLASVPQCILERALAFPTLARAELMSFIFGGAVGLLAAWWGAGVWSLVIQSFSTQCLYLVLVWHKARWWPRLVFQTQRIAKIRRLSVALTGSLVLNFLERNADFVLVGRFLGAEALGYYSLAYRIVIYPLQSISSVVQRVVFPVYSRMQSDHARMRQAYTRSASAIAMLAFPLMTGLMALHAPFIAAILGPQWHLLGLLMLIFGPVGMMQSLGATIGVLYQAQGRTDLMLAWQTAASFFSITAFAVGLKWGILGVAASYVAMNALLFYPGLAIPFRLVGLSWREFVSPLGAPFLVAVLMGTGAWFLNEMLTAMLPTPLCLALSVAGGILIYLLLLFYLDREQVRTVMKLAWARKEVVHGRTRSPA